MIEADILREKFQAVTRAERKIRRQRLAILGNGLLCALLVVAAAWPEWLPAAWRQRFLPSLMLPIGALALLSWWRCRRLAPAREVARALERRDPSLDGLALTAADLLEKPEPGFLDRRVISQLTDHAATHDWPRLLIGRRARVWGARSLLASNALLILCIFLASRAVWRHDHQPRVVAAPAEPAVPEAAAFSVTLTPGDVEVEKGSRVVVEAAFAKDVPASAALVISSPDGMVRDRLSMRLAVDGQVFGGMIPRVDEDALYHVEFSGEKSRQHRITTFVHPALERVDVRITPPAYTGLPPREVKNTMKVSALEGSTLDFTLKVNKPVKDAELYGQDKTALPLRPAASDPTILTTTMKAEKSQKWRVHLVDDKERANKNPPWITVNVQANQLAKIEVVFPKRDVQVSQIQEMPVEARVWDDLSVSRSGVSFSIGGNQREVTFTHAPTAPAQKQAVRELLSLEAEQPRPRQLVSYHFWAEDTGPQGEVRRAMSDMFFAEVRHFEDIFREGESPPGEPGKEPKGQTDELVELQKQVVNATWRIVRDTNAGRSMEQAAPDAKVVHTSQALALEQTKEAMEKVEDAQVKQALTEAWKSMKDALDPLEQAAEQQKRASLNQALTFEQSALEWLHQAQSREHTIMRSKASKMASSGKQKQMQNQLMNLELKQEEQRYEEEKQASAEQSAEQQENLQVLNRLKELARRQEALAEKMKELQNQLAKAKGEEERQELENQLQRLEDEQKQLLGDIDDLQQRMEQPENAASMAAARQQLEQTREQASEAAEKLQQQQLAQAANAATRAQRGLEEMQEDLRQKTAKQFSEEMKQMRQQAREAVERQQQIAETLENQKSPQPGREGDTSADLDKMLQGGQTARQIQEQQEKVARLLEDMKRVSGQAEGSNPLLHRRLYEAAREAQSGGLEQHLDEARMQSRYGQRTEAQDAERKANALVEKLQQGVEKAAESVLGSESDALRMARAELDKLIQEAQAEAADKADPMDQANPQTQPGKKAQMAGKGEQKPQDGPGEAQGSQPGKDQPGKGGPGQEDQRKTAAADKPDPTDPSDPSDPANPANPQTQAPPASAQAQKSPQPGKGAPGRQNQPGAPNPGAQPDGATAGAASSSTGGAESPSALFFDLTAEAPNDRPFTGDGYNRWTDRLRNVEELLTRPELRNEAARVLDHARELRVKHERNDEAPQADHLRLRILSPLAELRDRVAEELARRDAKNPATPVDRDPVPPAFRELVKRYYQELGGGGN